MKNLIIVLFGVALISSLFIAPDAMAWRCGMGMGGGGWCGWCPNNFSPFWASNITAEQAGKLTDLQKNHIDRTSKLRSELAVKRIEIDLLLEKPQPNTKEIMAKQNELTQFQSQLQQECLKSQLEMRELLTDEELFQLSSGYGQGWMRGYGPPQGRGYGPGWMRGYGPPQGRGYGPGGWGYGRNRMGYGPCWWQEK